MVAVVLVLTLTLGEDLGPVLENWTRSLISLYTLSSSSSDNLQRDNYSIQTSEQLSPLNTSYNRRSYFDLPDTEPTKKQP